MFLQLIACFWYPQKSCFHKPVLRKPFVYCLVEQQSSQPLLLQKRATLWNTSKYNGLVCANLKRTTSSSIEMQLEGLDVASVTDSSQTHSKSIGNPNFEDK
ncbi:hypothetical protein SLE2022_232850 [Rubroshorea leprosula]